jgi:hypothetical protein
MRNILLVAVLAVVSGCAAQHPGVAVPCDGPLPMECDPAADGFWMGCGGSEWEAYDLVTPDGTPVVGCRVVAAEAGRGLCSGGFDQCADGDVVRCGVDEGPSDDVCSAMLAECQGDRCRFPPGWSR